MNQVKTAFLMVAMTVLLVLFARLVLGANFVVPALVLAIVMNGAAYWFSDRIALAAAHAQEVTPEEAPMLHRLADRLAVQYRVPKPRVFEARIRRPTRSPPDGIRSTPRSASTRDCSASSTRRSCTACWRTSSGTSATGTS